MDKLGALSTIRKIDVTFHFDEDDLEYERPNFTFKTDQHDDDLTIEEQEYAMSMVKKFLTDSANAWFSELRSVGPEYYAEKDKESV